MRKRTRVAWTATVGAAGMLVAAAATQPASGGALAAPAATTTPIKHLVVIFDENVSFDHYFGTYPHAANTDGIPFHAKPGTPRVNGLRQDGLLTKNANRLANGSRANPQRLSRSHPVTCDQDHGYTAEQQAYDGGKMDKFVQFTDNESCAAPEYSQPGLVMDYYDGNTVTGLWNYAQRFAMSDNSYDTTFGPSTPGALNLVSGQTGGAVNHATAGRKTGTVPNGPITTTETYGSRNPNPTTGKGTVINDPDPYFDKCSGTANDTMQMTGKNVGDYLNEARVTWGWFEGGFDNCNAQHANIKGVISNDYVPHHEPFQYYKSTANPNHLPPSSVQAIGRTDQANHQYGMSDWWAALNHNNLPAVSFLKPPAFRDGHAGYSDPLDEQHFVVNVLNSLQNSKYWTSTAVVLAYDDSDGWYDHQPSPIVNASRYTDDALNGPSVCARTPVGSTTSMLDGYQDRCGYGPRLPLLIMSRYARSNTVDHNVTDQTSVLRFIEDNWLQGRRVPGSFDHLAGSLNGMFSFAHPSDTRLILNPLTGTPIRHN